jgi:hypothetical protein
MLRRLPHGMRQPKTVSDQRMQKEKLMKSSKQARTVVRKPTKKIADSRRVRYGTGSAPRVLRAQDAATRDSGAIRFGTGSAPASLRK